MTCSVFDRITALLRDRNIEFRHVRHGPVQTSEEAATARGEPLEIGGKSLVIKVDADFRLFVLSAAARLETRAVKRHFRAKGIRFASPVELKDLTALVPGSVPPFGEPILPLPLYVDPSVFANQRIAFNAGSMEDSLIISTVDYRRVAQPEVFKFSQG
jgi:prolyl-tRNA editing enzyme YbaK/EbsC (Cys-tRNA(Pro) deacylase)